MDDDRLENGSISPEVSLFTWPMKSQVQDLEDIIITVIFLVLEAVKDSGMYQGRTWYRDCG